MDILIKNGILVTMDKGHRILKNFSIGVEEGLIKEIDKDIKGGADFVVDATNHLVMPGLINTHTHLAMTLFRGIADDISLMKWLREEIWPLETKLEAKHVYAGSLLGCLELIKSGTTCFNDMYFFLDDIARSVEESGLRATLSYAMIDLGDREKAEVLLKEGENYIKKYKEGRVRAFFGPHAPYTCSEELLVKTKELADKYKTGIHIHVAETEVENSKREIGMRPFEYLEKIDFLGSNVVVAHSVWVSKREITLLKKRDVKIAHNPTCNLKIASGIAPVPEFVDRGITVSLGTDGAASNNTLDMFGEMKTCALIHKARKADASVMPAQKVLEFATINGARALGMEKEIGSLEVGKRADIILIDLDKPNLTPLTNPVSHLVYSAKGCDVDTVIVDGRLLMEKRTLRTLDQQEVLKFANEQAKDLLEKAGREDRLF